MEGTQSSSPLPTLEHFQDLVRQANDGIAGGLQKLRACIREHPEIYDTVGDLARMAIERLIATAAGDDVVMAESLRCSVEAMRQELLGDAPTVIERIAVDRVIIAQLEANYLSAHYLAPSGNSSSQSNAIANQRTAAERRLQMAMKSLLTLRAMADQTRSLRERFKVVG